MKIPDKLINFMCYKGNKFIAMADVDLPSIESMTETLSGAGIAGEIETATLGQFASMTTTINFRTTTEVQIDLLEPKGHMLDFRGSMQLFDSSTGRLKPTALKVTMNVIPKTSELGKLEVGATMDASSEMEVTYLKISIEKKEKLEIDKANFIFKTNGIDHLEKVREDLGMY